MVTAETVYFLCPRCHGQKTTIKPPWIAGDVISWTSTNLELYECPTCEGKGFIVPQEVV